MDLTPPFVFLNFRKEDTGRTFVSHLYRSLEMKGIRTYKDENPEEEDGRRISSEVTKAIEEANISVVVMSENFASSVWCLDVLAAITSNIYTSTIKAVFYEVDPADLTKSAGKFADDLRRHEERETPATVNRWRYALKRLGEINFPYCSRIWENDSTMLDHLIKSIVSTLSPDMFYGLMESSLTSGGWYPLSAATNLEPGYSGSTGDVYTKHIPKRCEETGLEGNVHQDASLLDYTTDVSPSTVSDNDSIVGMTRHKKSVYELLDLESKHIVRTIGIWGNKGVGKTTLAECVFDDISPRFQHLCFLSNVNNIYHKRISTSLLNHLTMTKSSSDIFAAIKPSLVNRNVLLVVDGVDSERDKLKDVMKVTRWLGPGSRIIMTSDDKNSLVSCGMKHFYEMECPRYEEALQIFSLYAFKKTCPLNGFEGFSIRVVHFAGRLPLALKVLGSFLYDKDEEIWKKTLRRLESSQGNDNLLISNYIAAGKYFPRRQTEVEEYGGGDDEEEEHSSSYHMLL